MNTSEIVKFVQENEVEDDANDLLYCLDINAEQRFNRACKMLSNLLADIKKTYPEANYVVSDDHIELLLGHSHSVPDGVEHGYLPRNEFERKNKEVIAADYLIPGLYRSLE